MEIQQEIFKHLQWIETVVSLIGSRDLTGQEVQEVSRQDRCEMGRWLGSDESGPFRNFPEFEQLRASHQAFHALAGELIAALQNGNDHAALATQQKFIETSQAVIGYLEALRDHASAA